MPEQSLRAALAQIAPVFLDRAATVEKVLSWIEKAADEGAGLVAFGEALEPAFEAYAAQICANAKRLAAGLEERNLRICTGGTDTHVMLVDLRPKGLTGKQAQATLDLAGITTNKNTIPYDPASPFVTSGVRLGTPALTSRGMQEAEMDVVARLIDDALEHWDNEDYLAGLKEQVRDLCSRFPVPGLD